MSGLLGQIEHVYGELGAAKKAAQQETAGVLEAARNRLRQFDVQATGYNAIAARGDLNVSMEDVKDEIASAESGLDLNTTERGPAVALDALHTVVEEKAQQRLQYVQELLNTSARFKQRSGQQLATAMANLSDVSGLLEKLKADE